LLLNETRQYFCLILCAGLSCLVSIAFAADGQELAVRVMVDPSVSSIHINVEEMRRIFSMRQTTWSNNQAITVYVLSNQHQTHQAFSTKVLNMFPYFI
jgi:ABC-type phosphate transport system substrate-binding protein